MSEQLGEMNTPDDTRDQEVDSSAMTVGAADPQAPSHADAGNRWLHGGGDVSDSPEEQDTDVVASAARMAPHPRGLSGVGDPQDVPVASRDAAPGTSEGHGVVQGARTPSTGQ